VVAVYAAPSWRGDDGLEFLRVVAALVACGREVVLLETADVLVSGRDLPDEAERILEHLAAFGVRPETPDEADLAAAVGEGASLLRLGDPGRTGTPPLAVDPDPVTLRAAGQVIRSA